MADGDLAPDLPVTTPPGWPSLLFDDPHRYKIGLETYSHAMVLQTWASTLLVTLLAHGCNRWFSGYGLPWNTGMTAVWALAVLQYPALLVAQRLIRGGRRVGFQWAFVVQSLVQLVWLLWLCWVSVPFVWFPAMLLLCGWALHDAWLTASWKVRAIYVAMFPTFDLLLVLHDLALGRGVHEVARDRPALVIAALGTQAVVAVLLQALMVVVGREGKTLEQSQQAEHRLQRELALRNRERQVIQRSCTLLAHGLTVSSFSHSLAGPVSALNLSTMDLEDLRGEVNDHLPASAQAALARVIEEQKAATKRIIDMTRGLARSLATREALAPRPVGQLVAEALAETKATVAEHGVQILPPGLDLAEGSVWVEPGHVSALANVLTNGVLHASHAPLEIRGEPRGPYFYQLSIRDHGVSGAARDKAIETIRSLTSMVEWGGSGEDRERIREGSYRGFGIGLTLTRLQLLRHNGVIEPGIPRSGAGLVFHIVLPTADPTSIPATENQPERLVGGVAISGSTATPTQGGPT